MSDLLLDGLYKHKLDEVVAAQFTGGAEQAGKFIQWVMDADGTATWTEAFPAWQNENGSESYPADIEHIKVRFESTSIRLQVGDWLIWYLVRENGYFVKATDEMFKLNYQPIDNNGALI